MQLNTGQWVRAIVGLLLYLILIPLILFWSAGTLAWPAAWIYTALLLISSLASRLIVFVRDPDALRERAKFTSAQGVPVWDRVLVLIVGMIGPALMALIAGLDHRFGWSPEIRAWISVMGGLLVSMGYGLAVWAMIENPYFSSVARIQDDRGHAVVTRGPYRMVRHPAYAGSLLAMLGFPLMMSALWSYVPGAIYMTAIIIRTHLEDQLLRDELEGYQIYARETPSRLLPLVW